MRLFRLKRHRKKSDCLLALNYDAIRKMSSKTSNWNVKHKYLFGILLLFCLKNVTLDHRQKLRLRLWRYAKTQNIFFANVSFLLMYAYLCFDVNDMRGNGKNKSKGFHRTSFLYCRFWRSIVFLNGFHLHISCM